MKRLLTVVGFILGLSTYGHALTYFTTTSTGICISTGGGYNIVEVRVSTPADATGTTRLILIDSNAISMNGAGFERADRPGVVISTQNFQLSRFTEGQYIIPPAVVLVSTAGWVAGNANPQPNVVKVGEPNGYTVRNGLVVLLEGAGTALHYISVGIEQVPTGGYWRR